MGNHIWTLGSKQIPIKHNHWTKDTSEEEEEEDEAPCDLCCTIPHPNGEAGWGGDSGRGFNIQNLIGLSEDKAQYNATSANFKGCLSWLRSINLPNHLNVLAWLLLAKSPQSLFSAWCAWGDWKDNIDFKECKIKRYPLNSLDWGIDFIYLVLEGPQAVVSR